MDARSRTRLVTTHAVMRALRNRDFRAGLPATNRDGQRVIIPALPDDTMGQFFDQLRIADATVYLAALDGDGVTIVTMEPLHEARHAAASDEDCLIYRHTEFQMVVNYLRTQRAPVVCREAPQNVLFDIIDDGTDALPVG